MSGPDPAMSFDSCACLELFGRTSRAIVSQSEERFGRTTRTESRAFFLMNRMSAED